jgi:tight adherence protein B
MKWLILLLFMFSSLLFFVYLFQLIFLSDKRLNKRMKHYLDMNDKKELGRHKFNVLVQMRLYKQSFSEQILTKKKNEKLEVVLGRAGIPLKPEEYIMFQWILAALFGGILYLISTNLFFLGLGVVLGYLTPRWWVKKKQSERLLKFNDGLPDMITTIIGSLRAGFSFAQSLKTVTDEADSPIKEEIEIVLKEMQYGSNVEDALQQLKERMPSEDLDLMIQSVLIQKQVGGNLATVLDTIVQTIRDRNKIARQIMTLTAQGRLSGVVIGLLPVVLGLVIYLMQPEYMGSFFKHPIGIMMISGGAVSGIIGFIFIRKITRIEV